MKTAVARETQRDDEAEGSGRETRARHAVYGRPPRELVEPAAGAIQLSPLMPGAEAVEDLRDLSLAGAVIAAPPGTIERRHVLAHLLRASAAGAVLVAVAPKDKGGARLAAELAAFGCAPRSEARRHHRIVTVHRPEHPAGIDAAIAAGAARHEAGLGHWTQPGVFSWDKIDAGSALLVRHLPPLAGRGADLGCGIGILARAALGRSPAVTALHAVDIDRRAVDCARRNVEDPRARFDWADVRAFAFGAEGLDFVLTNPPFHDGGAEDRELGVGFIRRASEILKRGGRCLLVANRHLPYEAPLGAAFASVRLVAEEGGFKVYEAVR